MSDKPKKVELTHPNIKGMPQVMGDRQLNAGALGDVPEEPKAPEMSEYERGYADGYSDGCAQTLYRAAYRAAMELYESPKGGYVLVEMKGLVEGLLAERAARQKGGRG